MAPASVWTEIREGLRVSTADELRRAIVRVGKIKAENLPDDIGQNVINQFNHPDPDVRAEAIRAIGLHWRLESAVQPIIDRLASESDWHVQIASISALGALGLDHPETRCSISKALAGIVLDETFADNERMIAYLELLNIQGRIGPREYLIRDKELPEKLADCEIDSIWVENIRDRK